MIALSINLLRSVTLSVRSNLHSLISLLSIILNAPYSRYEGVVLSAAAILHNVSVLGRG